MSECERSHVIATGCQEARAHLFELGHGAEQGHVVAGVLSASGGRGRGGGGHKPRWRGRAGEVKFDRFGRFGAIDLPFTPWVRTWLYRFR